MSRALSVLVCAALACSNAPTTNDAGTDAGATGPFLHASAIAITSDGSTLFVVNPDADSISILDAKGRTLTAEVLLAGAHPQVDGSGAYAPAVMPRSLVLSSDEKTLYVTGERSGKVHAVDVASHTTGNSVAVCSEPVSILLSPDGASLYVACSQDNTVARIDAASLTVKSSVAVGQEPWALAWAGSTLYASQFLTGGVSAIDPIAMTAKPPFVIPDVEPRGDKRLANGQPRGLYDIAPRPGTSELWVALSLLGTKTAQPDLDFESTTFATLVAMTPDGSVQRLMSINAQDVPGVNGAFADVVSGPHAVAFTKDGAFALMVDTNSEDVLVVDATNHAEASMLRPLPGHQPEAIVFSPDEKFAYVHERNTNDVVVLDVNRTDTALTLAVDGAPIATLASDPMPQQMRFGQHLFYSANSDEYPITTNHWVACATCHMEGRSDAVTWRFTPGPRDTPTNAGGVLATGFLFRTADRTKVQDYWRTINIEQGGRFDATDPTIQTLLDAIATYVNFGIPLPIPPTTDPTLVAKGQTIFQNNGCTSCHAGARFTDSGSGNPTLDLSGPITLHDVGTCVTGGVYPDVAHTDIDGNPRDPCKFDTPSLNGVWSTPPYFHDGSAATLSDAASRMLAATKNVTLSPEDLNALTEYLKSLWQFALVALLATACSTSPAASDAGPIACDFVFTGNVYSASSVAACATVSQDADAGGDWIFAIDAKTTGLERIQTTIDLGSAPVTGVLTNDSVASWDVTAISATSACVFQAGSTEAPNGTFTLQLDAFDAPTKTAHGTLVANAYLHQPPNTNCGYGDIESITIHF